MFQLSLPNGCELRLLEPSDAQELHRLIEANRPRLARWMAWAHEQTPAQTLAFVCATRRQLAENDGLQAALVADGRIIGVAGFHGVDWQNRSASIGYWLGETQEGRGTMTQAVRALTGYAFDHWGLNRVEIRVDVENLRSRAIPERLGFQQEGTLRQSYRIVGDRYSDDVVYAMLAADWR